MAWLTVLGVLVVIVYYLILTRKRRQAMSVPAPQPQAQPISIEQARAMVDELIARGETLFVEQADKAVELPESLGSTTRECFSRYGVLRTRRGGFQLAASEVHPSKSVRGYLSIGHSEDWDVVQKPGGDEVFVIEGFETREDEMEVRFPSVYHLALDEAQKGS
jgi:hypothetical protein